MIDPVEAKESEILRLRQRVQALERRLEIDRVLLINDDGMVEITIPSEERLIGRNDGIDCRDATIRGLELLLDKAQIKIEKLKRKLKKRK